MKLRVLKYYRQIVEQSSHSSDKIRKYGKLTLNVFVVTIRVENMEGWLLFGDMIEIIINFENWKY